MLTLAKLERLWRIFSSSSVKALSFALFRTSATPTISVPISKQSAVTDVSERACAYGVTGVSVEITSTSDEETRRQAIRTFNRWWEDFKDERRRERQGGTE